VDKILQISSYPPPFCGWATQTKLLAEELRRRGHTCEVLNINENRKKKNPEYVDVQGGLDYVWKLLRFGFSGYRFQMHANAMGTTLFYLSLAALLVGRIARKPAVLTFHGGLPQTYFPEPRSAWRRRAYQLLFRLAGRITCDSAEIKQAIESYGIPPEGVEAIPCFSAELLAYRPTPLTPEIESFLGGHQPVFFCYVSFRPEYHLPVLREAMSLFAQSHPRAGFIWLGFPEKELDGAREFIKGWAEEEARRLLLLGNLPHDEFLTLLTRCTAYIRTPACDGISASVIESLAHGVPVVASANGRRPPGVVTYQETNASDLAAKLGDLMDGYEAVKSRTRWESAENNTARMADFLHRVAQAGAAKEVVHAR